MISRATQARPPGKPHNPPPAANCICVIIPPVCIIYPQIESWQQQAAPSHCNKLSPRGISMKRITILTTAILFLIVCAMPATAQDATQSSPSMQMYHVAMVMNGPNWQSQNTQEGMDIRMEVISNIEKAAKKGLVVSAGLVNDETNVEFIIIFNVKNKYEAMDLMEMAPNVKNGMYKVDLYSWFAPKGLAAGKK